MDEDIVVNVEFEGTNLPVPNFGNVQVVPFNIAWEDLELMLKVYSDQGELKVQYTDDEKDLVTIRSDEELRIAFQLARECNNTLNLTVNCEQPSSHDIADDIHIVTADIANMSVFMKPNPAVQNSDMKAVESAETPIKSEIKQESDLDRYFGLSQAANLQADDKKASKKPIELSDESNPVEKTEKKKRMFMLRNAELGLVLDVQAWGQNQGTPIILWKKKDLTTEKCDNQLWYEDPNTGTIRSVWNGYCLDASANGASTMRFVFGKTSQQWHIVGERVQHRFNPNWVMCAPPKGYAAPGVQVMAADYTGAGTQHWVVEHIEKPKIKVSKMPNLYRSSSAPQRKRERARGYYSRLAEKVNEKSPREAVGVTPPLDQSMDRDESPAWFTRGIQQLKQDLLSDMSEHVSRSMVRQVLQGLEGAVVTSLNVASPSGSSTPSVTRSQSLDSGSRVRYNHDSIICDSCEQNIVGIRYKCGNCCDYDLCEACELIEGVHNPTHVFLKLRLPVRMAGYDKNGKLIPLLRCNIYSREGAESWGGGSTGPEKNPMRHLGESVESLQRELRLVEKLRRKEEKLKKQEDKLRKKEVKVEEKLRRRQERVVELATRSCQRSTGTGEEQVKRSCDGDEQPRKRERLDLPQFRMSVRMAAEFLRDVTLPDGSVVGPGDLLVKSWEMRNTGTHAWTAETSLKMMWGNLIPAEPEGAEVDVPHIQVGETGILTVTLQAPKEPGTYQCHWRLTHAGARFGHRVWCSVQVQEPQDTLKDEEAPTEQEIPTKEEESKEQKLAEMTSPTVVITDEASPPIEDDSAPEVEYRSYRPVDDCYNDMVTLEEPLQTETFEEADERPQAASRGENMLTREDLAKFEMLEIEDHVDSVLSCQKMFMNKKDARVSHTATPNNTPLESRDVTPPKSPIPEEFQEVVRPMSNSSSVELVSAEPSPNDDVEAGFSDLVKERMAGLTAFQQEYDMGSVSSFSDATDDSSDSDSDFYIVPIPDCFNPALPASKEASTSIYVAKDSPKRTVDEMLTASGSVETQPLLPTTAKTTEAAASWKAQKWPETATAGAEISQDSGASTGQPLLPTTSGETLEAAAPIELRPSNAANCCVASVITQDGDSDQDFHEAATQQYEDAAIDEDNSSAPEAEPAVLEEPLSTDTPSTKEDSTEQAENTTPKAATSTTEPGAAAGDTANGSHVWGVWGGVSKAAVTALSTAKDVFQTLQAANQQYNVQNNTWTPQNRAWTPPEPKSWSPPEQQWSPASAVTTPLPGMAHREGDSPAMRQLLEMGFGNRERNTQLLEKHGGNVESVVQALLADVETAWGVE